MDATPTGPESEGFQRIAIDDGAAPVADGDGETLPETAAEAEGDVAIVELNARPLERVAVAGETAPRRRAAPKRTAPKRAAPAKRRRAAPSRPRRAAGAIEPELYLFRLVSRSELGRSGVVAVQTPVGRLAVGIANGEPFAVSDTCRHLFASLGEGRVTRDGCLQCPWHRSRYDVTTGHMVRGPQGLLFLSVREIVRAYTNLMFPLHVHPVVERDGVLYLETAGEDVSES